MNSQRIQMIITIIFIVSLVTSKIQWGVKPHQNRPSKSRIELLAGYQIIDFTFYFTLGIFRFLILMFRNLPFPSHSVSTRSSDSLDRSFNRFHMPDHHLAEGSLPSVHSLLIFGICLHWQYFVPSSKHTSSKFPYFPRLSPLRWLSTRNFILNCNIIRIYVMPHRMTPLDTRIGYIIVYNIYDNIMFIGKYLLLLCWLHIFIEHFSNKLCNLALWFSGNSMKWYRNLEILFHWDLCLSATFFIDQLKRSNKFNHHEIRK